MIFALIVLVVLVTIGVRMPVALAAGGIALVLNGEVQPLLFPQLVLSNINSFTLLAVPLYLWAGTIMTEAELGERIFAFVTSALRRVPGALGHATLGSTIFFAGMTGSSAADVAAVGSTALPAAERLGYRKEFIVGIVSVGGSLGILVPPSLTFIVYGGITNTSVVDLFKAGILPAAILGGFLTLQVAWLAYRGASGQRSDLKVSPLLNAFRLAFLAILTPVIIAAGIYTGFVTPTEAGALAVVYATGAGLAQRTLTFRKFWTSGLVAASISAMLFLMIAAASTLGQVLTLQGIPQHLTDFMTEHFGESQFFFLLFVNLLFIVLGCLLESFSIMLMMIPLLFPTALALGIDPVHFGVIVVINIEIGLLTPPYGTNLYAVSAISNLPVWTVARAGAPYLISMLIGLIIVTYVPWFALALVR